MLRLIIDNKCYLCGNRVEVIPDNILKSEPGEHNSEFVVTHLGRKKYIHTKCWYGMIEDQKKGKVKYGN